jgi:membrane protease YdiL (CAAX protease family)
MWPKWAFPFSIAFGVVLIGVAVGLVVASAGRGAGMFALTLAGTLLAGAIGWVYMTLGQRYRLRGGRFGGKLVAAELVSAAAAFAIFLADRQLAATVACARQPTKMQNGWPSRSA